MVLLQTAYAASERRACKAAGIERSSQRYRSRRDPQVALRLRLKNIAAARVRYGYRRFHVLLRREGLAVNHKRIYLLYSEEGLSIRTMLPRRKRAWRYRTGRPEIVAPNDIWPMDFMSDALFDGRPFRRLTIVDCCSREGLATVPRASFRAFRSSRRLIAWSASGVSQRAFGWTTAQSSPAHARSMGLSQWSRTRLL